MKQAVIIGATGGIGSRVADLLLQDDYEVTNISRSSDNLPDGVQHKSGDILSDKWKENEFPEKIDALVYCPGSINLKPFRSLKAKDFEADFKLNVLGAVDVLHHFQKALKKADAPSVVLYSTVAVQQGMPFHASISAAKGAIEGLVRTLASEWAPKIRVNAVAPSLVDTPLAGKLLSSEGKRSNADDRHPLKRVGQPDDIAHMTHFLLSDKASWMSGQVVGVDGGMSKLRV
ncbi:MAG: SDR family oxidoreductase [Bacteroidetes bacterium]|jgi:NAD(P)-dependent dehydrogenase (short-subunit alcohol dehydrogenase family)|nr:SDR family oxidoreductase [Bacteroidota bacterium]